MPRSTLISLAFCVASCGCLARQMATDGCDFRQALLDMYTEQVMDNLIRAAENRPLVQLAYRNLTVTELQTVKASGGDELDPSGSRTVSRTTSAVLASARGFTNKASFGAGIQRDRTMQFQADPVTGKQDVYDYYLAFAADGGLFCSSTDEPDWPVHMKKRCGKTWYWVPTEAAGVFMQLVLRTAFMLGPDGPPPVYRATRVISIAPEYNQNGAPISGKYVIDFADHVPSDGGTVDVSLPDGTKLTLALFPFSTMPFEKGKVGQLQVPSGITDGQDTYTLYAQGALDADLTAVAWAHARILSNNYPKLGYVSPDLDHLQEMLRLFRHRMGR